MAYSLGQTLAGKNLVVVGGTGFLGKVWLALVLSRFPEIGHIYLVVRPKEGQDARERFASSILGSEVFGPLREKLGVRFDAFIREKVTPMAGDVSRPLCGIEAELRDRMRGRIAALVNVAGIVDFDPPLDEALNVNAFGCQNLVSLARDLGDARILHTSTCYTAGGRTGPVPEVDPRDFPFPRAGEIDPREWSPDREIAECLDVIEQARHRASDAFQQSAFLDQAKQNLASRDEPIRGAALERELGRVKRRYVEAQLRALGMERAKFWGWPNTYTYTKSIGEQIVASSGLPFTIVRPAIVESTLEFPFPGWNEGINTSAPFIFLIREGGLQIPGSSNNLDLIPCDLVCAAILIATGELIDGSQKPVYQAAASDTNPCTMARFFELSGLYKREFYQRTGKGGPLVSKLQEHFESGFLSKAEYESYGPHFLARGAELAAGSLARVAAGPFEGLATKAQKGLRSFADDQRRLARVMDTFLPFVAQYQYVFETKNTRAAALRLDAREQALVPFRPELIDWRSWFLDIHAPTLEKRVFPLMEAKRRRPARIPEAHETLSKMLEDLAERHELRMCLGQIGPSGISRLSYRELLSLSRATARRLEVLGVREGDRVLLLGESGMAWVVAFFGVLFRGATAVPVDPGLASQELTKIRALCSARAYLADDGARGRLASELLGLPGLSLAGCLETGPEAASDASSASLGACLSLPGGTKSADRAALLTHENITKLLATLAPAMPIGGHDRLLSALPLHDTFELLSGLLLPLSRGARVIYPEDTSDRALARGLKEGRPTVLIGDASVWQRLEAHVRGIVEKRGSLATGALQTSLDAARIVRKKAGIELGRILVPSIHRELGGSLRELVSSGRELGRGSSAFLRSLGMRLWGAYFVTETSSIVAVQPGDRAGHGGLCGRPLPGVEITIHEPSVDGIGEVWVRGPTITREFVAERDVPLSSTRDDWLRTGDLGGIDSKGRLTLTGRLAAAGSESSARPEHAPAPVRSARKSLHWMASRLEAARKARN